MVTSCVAYGCNERFEKRSSVSFHSFPVDEKRRSIWTLALKRVDFVPKKHSRLCSKHFSSDSFDNEAFGSGRKLKPDAVPSIFSFPIHLLSNKKKRKSPTKRTQEATNVERLSVLEEPPAKRSRQYRKTYVGDFNVEVAKSPRKSLAFMENAKKKLHDTRRKLRLSRQRLRRTMRKLTTAKALVNHLRKELMVTENAADTLEKTLSPAAVQLLMRSKEGPTRNIYPVELRRFALTLSFYSSQAYNYVRNVFPRSWPHPSTLKKWYLSVDGRPDSSKEAKTALTLKKNEMASKGKTVVCSLVMDEMCIRKQVEFSGKRFVGFVDFGVDVVDDSLPEAKEALVFMLVALNDNWKIPVGYFLVNGLSGSERSNLVLRCLEFLHELDIHVLTLTFDGAASNLSMAYCLGANFTSGKMKTWFTNPSTGHNIHILLDACHMLKLLRNALSSKGIFASDIGLIQWKYIAELEKLQNTEGLTLATKLTKRHIYWVKEPMKVKLAAQTFSKSVANALTYCNEDLKLPQFQGCEETVKFITLVNNVFDILNSRNLFSKGFKKPLGLDSIQSVRLYVEEAKQWLSSLRETIGGPPIVHSSRKTGFIGIIVCLNSVLAVYDTLISRPELQMNFLLTYKLSQDHLEVFFSAVRSRGGHNNNPTARQFEAAFKRLLVHIQIGAPTSANCSAVDPTTILNKSHTSSIQERDCPPYDVLPNSEVLVINHDHDYIPDPSSLTLYVEDVVEYISGFVVKKLEHSIKCISCKSALKATTSNSAFLARKNRGGLCVASQDVVYLCRQAEKVCRENIVFQVVTPLNSLVMSALQNANKHLFQDLHDHILDTPPLENHVHQLKKAILTEYLKIRLHHEARKFTEKLHLTRVRSFHTKMVLFKNQ